MVVSDPAIAKHVLRNYGTKYAKGLVAEVSEFLFGSGFAIAEDSLWTVILLLFLYTCILIPASLKLIGGLGLQLFGGS